jgi:hypothetical protein
MTPVLCAVRVPKNNSKRNPLVLLGAKDFKIPFAGRVEMAATDDFVAVAFFYEGNPVPQVPFLIPLATFADDNQLAAWVTEVFNGFTQNWGKVMEFETERHFANIANYCLHEMGLTSATLEQIIAEQVKGQERTLRARFNLPVGRGHFSKWERSELERVVVGGAKQLRSGVSWERLHGWLKKQEEHYADKLPKTPEALRRLCGRHGLTLREIVRLQKKSGQ